MTDNFIDIFTGGLIFGFGLSAIVLLIALVINACWKWLSNA